MVCAPTIVPVWDYGDLYFSLNMPGWDYVDLYLSLNTEFKQVTFKVKQHANLRIEKAIGPFQS